MESKTFVQVMQEIFTTLGVEEKETIIEKITNTLSEKEKTELINNKEIKEQISKILEINNEINSLDTKKIDSENIEIFKRLKSNIALLQSSILLNEIYTNNFIVNILKLMEEKTKLLTLLVNSKKEEGGDQPGEGGTQSGEGGDQSGEGGDQSGEGGDQSGEGGDQSGEGGTQPGEGGTQSGESGDQSREGGDQPGEGGTQPGEGGTQSGDSTSTNSKYKINYTV